MSCSCALSGIASRVGSIVSRPAALPPSTESQDIGAPRAALSSATFTGTSSRLSGATRTSSPGPPPEGGQLALRAVDLHVAMPHQLARGPPAGGEAHPVNDVVEPGFQRHQQVGALDPRLRGGALESVAELALREPVDPFHLLLL